MKNICKICAFGLIIVCLILSLYLSMGVIAKPHSDEELDYYEEVVKNIYAQNEHIIVEKMIVPDGISVKTTETTITVQSRNIFRRGGLIAFVQDGELKVVKGKGGFGTICFGIPFGLFMALFFSIAISHIYEKTFKEPLIGGDIWKNIDG